MDRPMNERKSFWVYASQRGGKIDPVALELLSKGRELADREGMRLEAVVLGPGAEALAEELLEYGPATVHWSDDPRLGEVPTAVHARLLAEAVLDARPDVLVLGADARNSAFAARVAARLGTGLSAHCVDLKLERGILVQTVPGFGGNIMANIVCPKARPQMATVMEGTFEASTRRDPAARAQRIAIAIPEGVRAARHVETLPRPQLGGKDLAEAEIVVAGGFGAGGREGWKLVEDLADALNAAVGATRPAVDEGWTEPDRMIGASGKVIAPRLYIGAGISGMMHHTIGIQRAKTIVAINSDPSAPIFALADYGLVGDLSEILPAIARRLRSGAAPDSEIQPPENTRSADDFRASLRRMRPNMHKFGRLIEDPVSDPSTKRTIAGHAQIFEAARDPRYQDLLTTTSHLTGKRISRYLSVIRSAEDMFANSKMKRKMFQLTGTCTGGRCAGWAAMNALWSVTWDMDAELGTDYHERLKNWLIGAQEKDITVAGALTDSKGLRSRPPSRQPDPDSYLHVVKRRSDGIVVKGAKVMICGVAAANEIFVMPTTKMRREDADYAVSFVIPKDSEGLTIVEARHPSDGRDQEEGFDNPVSKGGITQAYLFFENVFVPRERVFMDGEYAYAGEAVFRFTLPYRSAIGGCVAGQGDVMIGASILMARANGLDEKVFRDKIVDMIINNETTFGVGIAAAVMGTQHPSGEWLPDPVLSHANKIHVATLPYDTKRLAQDIAGGIAETGCIPSYQDFMDSGYGSLIEKYLKSNSPAETRIRIARLIEWLTIGGGVPGCMHGGGSPDGARLTVWAQSKLEEMIGMAKRVGGISDISLAKAPSK